MSPSATQVPGDGMELDSAKVDMTGAKMVKMNLPKPGDYAVRN